jgi:TatD DNase family protein
MKMLIDTHAHLDFPEFAQDLEGVLERAKKAGVDEVVSIGINLATSEKAIELANRYSEVYATVGIHPHDASPLSEKQLTTLETLARKPRVVAIGEVGLDYYRDRRPRPIQRQCLRQQLEVACKTRLPVVFHIREAHAEFFTIIADYATTLNGVVLHCFSGDWGVAKRCLDMGFYLSIPGTVTFPKAEQQQEVARRAPLDRLLVETDAPYLAPIPYRGKVNEPAFTRYTAEKVAELRGCSLEEVARQTSANAHRVFRIGNRTE